MSANEQLRILHVTDPHLYADSATELYGVRTDHSFRAVIDRALGDNQWQPHAVLATGDLAEDRSRKGYERFREIMQPSGLPILCLPGNHDNPRLMEQVLDGGAFKYCATHDIGPWRLILLNSHADGDEGGVLADLGVGAGNRVSVTSSRTTVVMSLTPNESVPRDVAVMGFNQAGCSAAELIDLRSSVTEIQLETRG